VVEVLQQPEFVLAVVELVVELVGVEVVEVVEVTVSGSGEPAAARMKRDVVSPFS